MDVSLFFLSLEAARFAHKQSLIRASALPRRCHSVERGDLSLPQALLSKPHHLDRALDLAAGNVLKYWTRW